MRVTALRHTAPGTIDAEVVALDERYPFEVVGQDSGRRRTGEAGTQKRRCAAFDYVS
ncbi:hypothetical protein [Streptomyces sp. NPDC002845]